MMLKSSIDQNGMSYKIIADSRQRQHTQEFQQAYKLTVVSIVIDSIYLWSIYYLWYCKQLISRKAILSWSLSPTFHFLCVNHNFWPSFANLQTNKGQHDGHSNTPASFSDLNRRIASFQLRINYQIGIGYQPSYYVFVVLATISSQTSSKKKIRPPRTLCFEVKWPPLK